MKRTLFASIVVLLLAAVAFSIWIAGDRPPTANPPTASPQASEPTAQPASARAEMREAAPTIIDEDDPPGTLTLEGQVLDAGDLPVAGAEVAINTRPERRVTSATNGTFAFGGLVPKRYRLSARKGALVGSPVLVRLSAATDPVILRLKPGAALEVLVEAGEKPVEGARVTLRHEGDRAQPSDRQGLAVFEGVQPGLALILVQAQGFAPAEQAVTIPAEGALRVRVQVVAGVSVKGRVLLEGGAPVQKARVLAISTGALLDFSDPDRDGVLTDQEGRFVFDALTPASYRFTARHRDHPPGDSGPVWVEERRSPPDVRIVLEASGALSGRVFAADGAKAPFATVRVAASDAGTFDGGEVRQAVADQDGRFRLKGLPRTRLAIVAQAEAGQSDVVQADLTARERQDGLELRLTQQGRIAGQVVDPDGQGVPEAEVTASPDLFAGASLAETRLRGGASVQTDGGGRFAFEGLPGGAFRLRASRTGLGLRERLQPGVLARTGDRDVRIVLTAAGGLRGAVQGADGAPIKSFRLVVDFPPGQPFTDEQGRFAMGDLPAGKHRLTIRGEGFAELTRPDVLVRAGEETDLGVLVVPRGRTVKGRVLDPNGSPVAGALVLAATQLVGDGNRVSLELGAVLDDQSDIRRATAGPDGVFTLTGLSSEPRLVLAEAERGRSDPVRLEAGTEDVSIELVLRSFGSLTGRITAGGQPAAAAIVTVSPKGVTGQSLIARTGQDGSFALERVPAGVQHVGAVLSAGGLDASTASAEVEVQTAKQARVELDVPVGDVDLIVNVTGQEGAKVDVVQALLLRGRVSFTTAAEMNAAAQSFAHGLKSGFWTPASGLRLQKIQPGAYSLCLIPINGNLNDPVFVKRLQRNTAALRVYCQAIDVAPSPAAQTVGAAVPAMDPLPPEPAP